MIKQALDEDIQSGDLTTDAILPKSMKSGARWTAKEEGIIAGLFIGEAVFQMLDENLEWNPMVEEGACVKPGDVLVEMEGNSRAILTGERTALNFVQRMCGIATTAGRYVNALQDANTQILDTRKTLPGHRVLDKYAVRTGGGNNHRKGLYDMILIKENHIAIAGSIQKAVDKAKKHSPKFKIEIETTSLQEVEEALSAGADIIMLDNMSLDEMRDAVALINGRAQTEASGNIKLKKINEIAVTGVDFISVGALTHSVQAFDISQLIM